MTDYRAILAAVSDSASGRSPLETAFLIGREMAAHVTALHVRTDPTGAVPLVGEGMSGVMVEEMIEAAERQAAQRAREARGVFDQLRNASGAPIVEAPQEPQAFSVAWREKTGREEDIVARCGRLNDLIVVGRPEADRELPSIMTLNAALMDSGRPILVAPPEPPPQFGQSVAIAWNGSAEAARAVAAALPLLRRAGTVTILAAREAEADTELSPNEMAKFLRWHGVDAACHSFATGHANTGDALLKEVMAAGADLLVMGAYTHSRLRQLILGGVTRHMLYHAAIPVLMMH